ncbi:thioredoxin family protein [Candidatus Bathyarchaeota archaeon]|nr:thioredoxin family protein [Candidatus Bathyarchaeota archaeon]
MKEIDTKQELNAELSKSKKVMVLFYATWCPFCIRFVNVFDEEIKVLKLDHVIHVLLDDYDNPLWDDYEIAAVPTIILFEDTKVSNRLDAKLGRGLKEEEFMKWLEKLK